MLLVLVFFFFNEPATTEIYTYVHTLALHDALPISGQFAQRFQLAELRGAVGVCDAARTQPVAEREGHVVGLHDLADVLEVFVEETLAVVRQAPLGDRKSTRLNSSH